MKTASRTLLSRSSHMLSIGFGMLLALIAAVTVSGITVANMEEVIHASAAARGTLLLNVALGVLGIVSGIIIAVLVTRQVVRTENALELEKELALVTLHSIGDGVITTDAEGRVGYLNPIAERYTEWPTGEARGRPLAEIYRVVDERTGKAIEPLVRPSNVDSREETEAASLRLVSRSGRECPIRFSCAPINAASGKLLGMIVVFHDISQIRAMAQQLL